MASNERGDNMIRVKDGQVVQRNLPKTGKLSDGRWVSNYHLLPEDKLKAEGWLPVEENKPDFDPDIERLVFSHYEILDDKVIVHYKAENRPAPEPEQDPEAEAVRSAVLLFTTEKIRADELDPEDIVPLVRLYPVYEIGREYKAGDLFAYKGELYEVVQGHTSQEDWKPDENESLYKVKTPEGVIKEWEQPAGSYDAYDVGDMVEFEGKVYESVMDGNVWSPSQYPEGWELVE